jgi:hypothetical protein
MIHAFFGSRRPRSIFETAQRVFRIVDVFTGEVSDEIAHWPAEVTFLVNDRQLILFYPGRALPGFEPAFKAPDLHLRLMDRRSTSRITTHQPL